MLLAILLIAGAEDGLKLVSAHLGHDRPDVLGLALDRRIAEHEKTLADLAGQRHGEIVERRVRADCDASLRRALGSVWPVLCY